MNCDYYSNSLLHAIEHACQNALFILLEKCTRSSPCVFERGSIILHHLTKHARPEVQNSVKLFILWAITTNNCVCMGYDG